MFSPTVIEEVSNGLETGKFQFLGKELKQNGFETCQLKYIQDLVLSTALHQLHIRQKYKSKFQHVFERFKGWMCPPGVPLQQASHHLTARFKAGLSSEYQEIIDLTGGSGMDTLAFADTGKKVIYLELNTDIYTLTAFNFKKYLTNVECINSDALEWLEQYKPQLKKILLYADPARRDKAGKKVFLLHDYQPDPTKILDAGKKLAVDVMLKVSPMADINYLHTSLKPRCKTYLLGTDNELKEVVLLFRHQDPTHAIETWLCEENPVLLHATDTLRRVGVPLTETPEKYLYIPHPSLCKTHADAEIAAFAGMYTFHPLAKIYTSYRFVPLKGWRIFETKAVEPRLKDLSVREAMIVTGIFPQNPEELRIQHKIGESDKSLLAATKTSQNKNLWILAEKYSVSSETM